MMNKGLTVEEITHLHKTATRDIIANRADPIWSKAFTLYNQEKAGLKKLGMGCRVCYSTVLYYFLQ
jgi:hypothetical protein